MRTTAFITAAFAAAALAVPLNEKRVYEYVTDTDVVMVTDVVTVTANGPPPAYTSYGPPPPAHHHHHHHHHSSYPAPPPSSSAPPPPPSSTEQPTSAPPPPPSSTYVPPTSSYAPPPSSSAAPPPASSSSAPSSGGSGGNYPNAPYGGSVGSADYKTSILNHHNMHRANHSASPLTWDDSLMDSAKQIAATCKWGHSMDVNGGGYGQNIAAGIQDSEVAQSITNMFYNGEIEAYSACYGETDPTSCNFESCGHFTQVVWKDTKTVACWTYDCSATGMSDLPGSNIPPYFTVCNYGPPGNYGGEYAANVMRPLGHPTVTVP